MNKKKNKYKIELTLQQFSTHRKTAVSEIALFVFVLKATRVRLQYPYLLDNGPMLLGT